ncbi:MAG: SWIM zinc finger family protein [Limnohabitans sp.]|nr:SWIM zinc finger family protein [Limnohabitans sp.]
MIFDYKYKNSSSVQSTTNSTGMQFAPDLNRTPTFFVGKLHKKLAFREAISALHDVVVSDLRFKPKDKEQYLAWLKEQESQWIADYISEKELGNLKEDIESVKNQLSEVWAQKNKILKPFYEAQSKYFKHLYATNKDYWFVLDPVITVHPDELFFECFSQDESSYGKLSCSHNVFTGIDEMACGTTNIDYSQRLYDEFQKIRDYKETSFTIDPSGFEAVTTSHESYKEVKIDLPESWVRGFLQVSSAMTLPATTFDLHPQDMYAICSYLRRFKETVGPRALRFVLKPGQPIQVVFEPWFETLTFHRSIYTGAEERTIRIWGRRRIHILERLLPISKKITVHLMGDGLPSFFISHMDDMTFTLGLSGWTANDWSAMGNFNLLMSRNTVDVDTAQRVFDALKTQWLATPEQIASTLGLDKITVNSALESFTQAGRVIYDLDKGVYRARELAQDPLPIESLRFSSPLEAKAATLSENSLAPITINENQKGIELKTTILDNSKEYSVALELDLDHKIVDGKCTCQHYKSFKMTQGPCEHMLASKMKWKKSLVFSL